MFLCVLHVVFLLFRVLLTSFFKAHSPVLWFLSLVNKPPPVHVFHVHLCLLLLRFHICDVYFLLRRWHGCFSPFWTRYCGLVVALEVSSQRLVVGCFPPERSCSRVPSIVVKTIHWYYPHRPNTSFATIHMESERALIVDMLPTKTYIFIASIDWEMKLLVFSPRGIGFSYVTHKEQDEKEKTHRQ